MLTLVVAPSGLRIVNVPLFPIHSNCKMQSSYITDEEFPLDNKQRASPLRTQDDVSIAVSYCLKSILDVEGKRERSSSRI